MAKHNREELSFMAISGINYPTKKRRYLMKLMKEAAIKDNAKFIVVAGNTLDGVSLEKELKRYTDNHLADVPRAERADRKIELEHDFIMDHAIGLSDFLPRIDNVNYHIVISEKIYDRPIGARILEAMKKLRNDVRLVGKQDDGSYDAEPKIPIGVKGFQEVRVIVPKRSPWFYRIITSFKQRLINAFIPRTFSPAPNLILVGCTGTASFIPWYDDVPAISIPTLHKIDEQKSTENMVGASLVRIVHEDDRTHIVNGTYDWRPAIFNEKTFVTPAHTGKIERAILDALLPSEASPNIIVFRINAKRGEKHLKPLRKEAIEDGLKRLLKKKLIFYSKEGNRYAIHESQLQNSEISLANLFKGSREVNHTVVSCTHVGCLKTLYHTAIKYLPKRIAESDTFIENGDLIQGMAHDYDYNGDVLPDLHGFDKQQIMAACLRARNLFDVFKIKYERLSGSVTDPATILNACLVRYVFNAGNHDKWIHRTKDTIPLYTFELKLRSVLTKLLLQFCGEKNIAIDYFMIEAALEYKIVKVGESRIVNLDGIVVGIKHPHKGGTQSKSHRIQDVVDFTWRNFNRFVKKIAQNTKGFALADVANFHTAAAVHVCKFGRTVFGLMTGAYLHDTSFETNIDKIVDFGSANMKVIIDPDDRLLYSEVEFDNYIHPDDEAIVLADHLKTSDVHGLSCMLSKELVNLPWRT